MAKPIPKNVPKKMLRLAVERLGGEFITEGDGRFINYELVAPPGHHWKCSGAHSLVVTSGYANVDNDARRDALYRVGYGVEKCSTEEGCEFWDEADDEIILSKRQREWLQRLSEGRYHYSTRRQWPLDLVPLVNQKLAFYGVGYFEILPLGLEVLECVR